MRFDDQTCDHPDALIDKSGNKICLKHITCFHCGLHIKKGLSWTKHPKEPHEKPPEPAVLTPAEVAREMSKTDSLMRAMESSDFDLSDMLIIDSTFRQKVRDNLGMIVEKVCLGGVCEPDRTDAWRYLLDILLSPAEDGDKLDALKALYDESEQCDELDDQLIKVVISITELFPTPHKI